MSASPTHYQGVGKALLRFSAKIAVAFDGTHLNWTAETTNPAALHDYRPLGAAEVSETVDFRLVGDKLAVFANGT